MSLGVAIAGAYRILSLSKTSNVYIALNFLNTKGWAKVAAWKVFGRCWLYSPSLVLCKAGACYNSVPSRNVPLIVQVYSLTKERKNSDPRSKTKCIPLLWGYVMKAFTGLIIQGMFCQWI